MVARLWGTANGTPVIFSRTGEPDQWSAAVPNSGTGTWVLSLWAEDEAGNVGYFATVKLLYSAKDLQWQARILDLGSGVTAEAVQAVFRVSAVLDQEEPDDLNSRAEITEIGEEALA